jgi:acyl-CoA thioesterase-1
MIEREGTRKRVLPWLLLLWFILAGCDSAGEEVIRPVDAGRRWQGTIIALGDSLTAGLGLEFEQSYPAQLQRKLDHDGYHYRVVNAGVSGETSSGTLSRLNWILGQKPDIVILEIGANDGLRGIDTTLLAQNLREILRILRKKGVVTVFTGMKMVWNLGEEYTTTFNRVYTVLAKESGVISMPFFLEGVAGVPALNRSDGIHPNEQGYAVITDNIYPYVLQAIEELKRQRELQTEAGQSPR